MDVQLAQIARKVTVLEVIDLQRIQSHNVAGVLMDKKDILILHTPPHEQLASTESDGANQTAGVAFDVRSSPPYPSFVMFADPLQTMLLGLVALKDRTDLGTVEVITSHPKVHRGTSVYMSSFLEY